MRRILPFLLFLTLNCIVSAGYAQDDSLFRFLKKIDYPVSTFAVDNLGELFLISTDNQLKKYNEKGDSIGVFNQVTTYGKLACVEAQNPWKTILFYEQFATVVLLDKYLNVLTSIKLRDHDIYKVHALTTSYDNNIWLYDEQENKIKKVNDNGDKLFESVDFRNLFDVVPTPSKIVDADGYLYLYDPELGIYKFDYYGKFLALLPFKGWKTFEVKGKTIFGIDEVNLYQITPPLPEAKSYTLVPALQNSGVIKIVNNHIFSLKNSSLEIFEF